MFIKGKYRINGHVRAALMRFGGGVRGAIGCHPTSNLNGSCSYPWGEAPARKAGSSSALPQMSAGGRDRPWKEEAGSAGGGEGGGGCNPRLLSVKFPLLTSFTRPTGILLCFSG